MTQQSALSTQNPGKHDFLFFCKLNWLDQNREASKTKLADLHERLY